MNGEIIVGDALACLQRMEANTVDCVVTSPPYWGLRDYGVPMQLGLEDAPSKYIANMVMVFWHVHRVLKPAGTLWLNIGDSYTAGHRKNRDRSTNYAPQSVGGYRPPTPDGLKPKELVGIPWRLAFALQADGWYLRSEIIWHKSNPMPESVRDRPTKAHEQIFLLSKSEKYFYDHEAIKETAVWGKRNRSDAPKGSFKGSFKGKNGEKAFRAIREKRNKRSVWTVSTKPFKGAHFATFPADLIEPCVLAGCPADGVVLDPFFGAGTTGLVAQKHGRRFIGIELNPEYAKMAEERIRGAI